MESMDLMDRLKNETCHTKFDRINGHCHKIRWNHRMLRNEYSRTLRILHKLYNPHYHTGNDCSSTDPSVQE